MVKPKNRLKTEFLSHFSTAEFILEYFQVWTIKFVNRCSPNKGEFTKPFRYYIYCHTRFVWLASKCSKTCSTNGNMVTRLYSKININCKKLYKKQRYAPIRLFSDSSYRSNDRCELTQDNTNLFIFIEFGKFI